MHECHIFIAFLLQAELGACDLEGLQRLCESFIAAYEAAAQEQASNPLPLLKDGFWLQSYGFSKACVNRYCQLLAALSLDLSCVACSPGFVDTVPWRPSRLTRLRRW